jgi:hypothetical protein
MSDGMTAAQMLGVGGMDSDDDNNDLGTPDNIMGKRTGKSAAGAKKVPKKKVLGLGGVNQMKKVNNFMDK